jgi:hypothetical protein
MAAGELHLDLMSRIGGAMPQPGQAIEGAQREQDQQRRDADCNP